MKKSLLILIIVPFLLSWHAFGVIYSDFIHTDDYLFAIRTEMAYGSASIRREAVVYDLQNNYEYSLTPGIVDFVLEPESGKLYYTTSDSLICFENETRFVPVFRLKNPQSEWIKSVSSGAGGCLFLKCTIS